MRVFEIYASVQGEGSYAGQPCAFIRLAGCPYACRSCDTPEALPRDSGREMTLDQVAGEVDRLALPLVEVTGGEPLIQKEVYPLLQRLLAGGRTVLLETSGLVDTRRVPGEVVTILDVKTPDSGEGDRMVWNNLRRLRGHDEVKFVLYSRRDYEWAKGVLAEYGLGEGSTVHFSPAFGQVPPQDLAAWILADRLPVRLNLQLHKYIWGADATGV